MHGPDRDPVSRLGRAVAAAGAPSADYDLNPDVVLPPDRQLVPAAVLVPVLVENGAATLFLTRRSSALRSHPGQIAFPGGRRDAGDASARAAALREASEEIGLDPQSVEVIGEMPVHETVTGFSVTPVVGIVAQRFHPVLEAGEVEEVFEVPLDSVTDPARFSIQARRWRGAMRRYYAVPCGPHYIWGATARILRAMSDAMAAP